MVFHESLNPERKFSLAIPLVFIAILGGTTAVLEVAIAVSPNSPYASNPQAQLAQSAAPFSSIGSPKTCDDAKKKARQVALATSLAARTDGLASGLDRGLAVTLDKCIGAKLNDSVKTVEQAKDLKNYTCYGRSGDVTITPNASNPSVISRTKVADVPEGTCELEICTTTSGLDMSCAPAKKYQSGQTIAGSATLPDAPVPQQPSDADAIDKLKQDAEKFSTLAGEQEKAIQDIQNGCKGDASCIDDNADRLYTLEQARVSNEVARDSAIEQIKSYGYGIYPDTDAIRAASMPGDYQGENPQAINAILKNNASYLGNTSPGLSQSDLLNTPLSELNGRYKYGDLTVDTDGKTYSIFEEGQRVAGVYTVGDGETVGDVIATKQYTSGPESPYQYGRDTFAARVEAQGEVPYSSAPTAPETPEQLAFREWSAGLPGANIIPGPAYDFSSDA